MDVFLRCFSGEWNRIGVRPPYSFLESQGERLGLAGAELEGVKPDPAFKPFFGVRWARYVAGAANQAPMLLYPDPLVPRRDEIAVDAVILCCSLALKEGQFAAWLFSDASRCLLPSRLDLANPVWVTQPKTRFYLEVPVGKTVNFIVFRGGKAARAVRRGSFEVHVKGGVWHRPRGTHRDGEPLASLGRGEKFWPTVRRVTEEAPKLSQLPDQIRDEARRLAKL